MLQVFALIPNFMSKKYKIHCMLLTLNFKQQKWCQLFFYYKKNLFVNEALNKIHDDSTWNHQTHHVKYMFFLYTKQMLYTYSISDKKNVLQINSVIKMHQTSRYKYFSCLLLLSNTISLFRPNIHLYMAGRVLRY